MWSVNIIVEYPGWDPITSFQKILNFNILQLLVRFSQYVQLVRQDTLEKALGMDGKNLRDIGEQLLGKNPKSC